MFKQILFIMLFFAFPCLGRTITLEYNVYAGGLKGLNALVKITEDGEGNYTIVTDAKTINFIGRLYPMTTNYKTTGTVKDGIYRPLINGSKTKANRKTRTKTLDFKDKTKEVDYQTAFLKTLFQASSGDCSFKDVIYSGKRTFLIEMTNKGKTSLSAKKGYGMYSGEALVCGVSIMAETDDMDYGWFFDQSEGLKAYYARVRDDLPYLLVRADMGTIGYGSVILYLAGVSVDDH